jgi:2-oxoglutarate ferredoxin oxidoreductase subunit beta
MTPEVVELGKGIKEDDLLFHDEKAVEPTLAYLLSRMMHPEFPEPIGVFRCVEKPRYDDLLNSQIAEARKSKGDGDLQKLFNAGDTWTVE